MTEIKMGLLENFAIRNWYRFVLYLGGVTLILSYFIEPKGITINNLRSFSIKSVLIGLVLWIVRDIIDAVFSYWIYLSEKGEIPEYSIDDYFKMLALMWWFANIGAFIIWFVHVAAHIY